jgi:capsular exopolysaccharide synthesis family protein
MKDVEKEIYWGDESLDPFYLERVKSLRSKVIHSTEVSGNKVLGITSATASEGKTTVSLNLASSIAAVSDKKVILIDGDLRKCDLTNALRLGDKDGLSDFLKKEDSKIQGIINNSKIENLHIVGSGKRMFSPSEILTKSILKNFLSFLKENYDIIIIDLPPVMDTADPITVKEVIDKFILVYFAGKTPMDLLEFTLNEVGPEKILGVILNGVDLRDMKKSGKYYYSYYSRQ